MGFSRGQGSTEYLFTYGIALIVMIIAGAFILNTGVLSDSGGTVTYSGFSRLIPQPNGIKVDSLGLDMSDFGGVFTNGVGDKIILTGVMVKGEAGEVACCSDDAYGDGNECLGLGAAYMNVSGVEETAWGAGTRPRVKAGDSFEVFLGPCTFDAEENEGVAYNVYVEIGYNTTRGRETIPHIDAGNIKGRYA